jgi:hypothetical protein
MLHSASQVASYAFLLPDDEGVRRRVLLPLLDLINHDSDVPNADVRRETGNVFVARAIKDVQAGEEVRGGGGDETGKNRRPSG